MKDAFDPAVSTQQWQRVKTLLAQALEQEEVEQSAFVASASQGDASLRDEVLGLLGTLQAAGTDALEQPPVALLIDALEDRSTRQRVGLRLGPYRVLSLIARGGMGEVYRAERVDGHYEQQVAIKLMRDNLHAEHTAARFKAERQILASLDHPNLAKVLDGGVTDEGLPYFVMEFVAGDPIDVYCDRWRLPVEARLRLFRTVCQVVHYAHQKNVVHRDLKTANILVTHEGVVKLVDFGIAKRVVDDGASGSADPARTATAFRAMTLAYSSPEQILGNAITPASDIYSLGVVLYRLLTGTGPYAAAETASDYELARIICDTEPVPPSRAMAQAALPRHKGWRGLGADLDAVVLMALRKDPGRRYVSAEQFADDVFRHLEQLPVQARRGAWGYRAGRFVVRHRIAVAAALLVNVALIGGLGMAVYESYEAKHQKQRAERHFAGVRNLANVFIFDMHDAIQDLPGSTPARRALVKNAVAYLQELSSDSDDDPALQIELAAAYRKIADIEGGPYMSNLGDPAAAGRDYQQSRDIAQRVLQRLPPTELKTLNAARRELARTLRVQAALLLSQGSMDSALEAIKLGIATAEEIVASEGDQRSNQVILANMHGTWAQLLMLAGRGDEFRAASTVAIGLLEKLNAQDPDDLQAGMGLGSAYGSLAQYWETRPDIDDKILATNAMAALRKSVAVLERLRQKSPQHTMVAANLAVAYDHVGAASQALGNFKEAVANRRSALQLLAPLLERDPGNVMVRVDYATFAAELGESLLSAGDLDASIAAAENALAVFEQAPDAARGQLLAQADYAWSLQRYGNALMVRAGQRGRGVSQARADRDLACANFRRSLAQVEAREKNFGNKLPVGNLSDLRIILQRGMQTCR